MAALIPGSSELILPRSVILPFCRIRRCSIRPCWISSPPLIRVPGGANDSGRSARHCDERSDAAIPHGCVPGRELPRRGAPRNDRGPELAPAIITIPMLTSWRFAAVRLDSRA